jgi:hypothetical protein
MSPEAPKPAHAPDALLVATPHLGRSPLREIAVFLARGYLRLLAQRAADPGAGPPPGNSAKPLDSRRGKSVNWARTGRSGGSRAS